MKFVGEAVVVNNIDNNACDIRASVVTKQILEADKYILLFEVGICRGVSMLLTERAREVRGFAKPLTDKVRNNTKK
jgi:hypothetical protein